MADSKPVNQEVNSTVILPPLVFPGLAIYIKMAQDILFRTCLDHVMWQKTAHVKNIHAH